MAAPLVRGKVYQGMKSCAILSALRARVRACQCLPRTNATFGAVHKGLKGSLLPTPFPVSEAKPLWRSLIFTR
jgi:hypothetical protein